MSKQFDLVARYCAQNSATVPVAPGCREDSSVMGRTHGYRKLPLALQVL